MIMTGMVHSHTAVSSTLAMASARSAARASGLCHASRIDDICRTPFPQPGWTIQRLSGHGRLRRTWYPYCPAVAAATAGQVRPPPAVRSSDRQH